MSKRIKRKKESAQPTTKEKILRVLSSERVKYILAGLVLVAVLTVLGVKIFSPKPLGPEPREQVLLTWLKSMEEIAVKTQDPKAREVLNFLQQNYAIGVPIKANNKGFFYSVYKHGKKLSAQNTQKNTVVIFIIQPGEPVPDYIIGSLDRMCLYMGKKRHIYIAGQRLETKSLTSMAFTIFHESFHALDDYKANYQDLSWEIMLEGERQAHMFHTDLIIKYLGDKVNPIITEMIQNTSISVIKIPNSINADVSWNKDYDDNSLIQKLKAIMWPVRSDAEVTKVWNLLRQHVLRIKITENHSLSPDERVNLDRHYIIEHNYKKSDGRKQGKSVIQQ